MREATDATDPGTETYLTPLEPGDFASVGMGPGLDGIHGRGTTDLVHGSGGHSSISYKHSSLPLKRLRLLTKASRAEFSGPLVPPRAKLAKLWLRLPLCYKSTVTESEQLSRFCTSSVAVRQDTLRPGSRRMSSVVEQVISRMTPTYVAHLELTLVTGDRHRASEFNTEASAVDPGPGLREIPSSGRVKFAFTVDEATNSAVPDRGPEQGSLVESESSIAVGPDAAVVALPMFPGAALHVQCLEIFTTFVREKTRNYALRDGHLASEMFTSAREEPVDMNEPGMERRELEYSMDDRQGGVHGGRLVEHR
ncbi:hypothetical protein FB451DRAFT_1444218 [Mycena latifolia]|nr:hypothetical protein FB451DRAFT_1444218 [Mycena latifolia]